MTDTISTHVTESETQRLTHADLRQFTGDLERYFHPLNRNVIYTPGVKYLADAGQAYWLLDAVASYFGSSVMNAAMQKDYRLRSMQFWRLTVSERSAVLIAEADAGEEPFIQQGSSGNLVATFGQHLEFAAVEENA